MLDDATSELSTGIGAGGVYLEVELDSGSDLRFPVPTTGGADDTEVSTVTTVVVTMELLVLLTSSRVGELDVSAVEDREEEDRIDDPSSNDLKKDDRSSEVDCRNSKSEELLSEELDKELDSELKEELLDELDELEEVAEAGAVEFVTIIRLTCRGK